MLLSMGTSPESPFKSTVGHIPAWLNCLFIVEDVQLRVKVLLALNQMLATGLITQTAGMVIVEEWHQPPMQSLMNRRYHCKTLFGIQTNDIVPIHAIQGAEYHLPLMPQPHSLWWYLCNKIALSQINLIYMLINWLDDWSNRCSNI